MGSGHNHYQAISHAQLLQVGLSVCVLVTTTSHTKKTEQIKVPFEIWTRVGRRNDVLDVDADPRQEGTHETCIRWGPKSSISRETFGVGESYSGMPDLPTADVLNPLPSVL